MKEISLLLRLSGSGLQKLVPVNLQSSRTEDFTSKIFRQNFHFLIYETMSKTSLHAEGIQELINDANYF